MKVILIKAKIWPWIVLYSDFCLSICICVRTVPRGAGFWYIRMSHSPERCLSGHVCFFFTLSLSRQSSLFRSRLDQMSWPWQCESEDACWAVHLSAVWWSFCVLNACPVVFHLLRMTLSVVQGRLPCRQGRLMQTTNKSKSKIKASRRSIAFSHLHFHFLFVVFVRLVGPRLKEEQFRQTSACLLLSD